MKWSIVTIMAVLAWCPASAQIDIDALETRGGLLFEAGSEEPYTGRVSDDGGMTGLVESGKRSGDWVWAFRSGRKRFVTEYRDGVRVRSTSWYENGGQRSEMRFVEGLLSGARRDWTEEGDIHHERFYREGKQHGKERLWDHEGSLLYTAEWLEGELHGAAIWWYPNGSKRWQTQYNRGAREGTWIQLADDGSLMMETEWAEGELVRRNNPHEGH